MRLTVFLSLLPLFVAAVPIPQASNASLNAQNTELAGLNQGTTDGQNETAGQKQVASAINNSAPEAQVTSAVNNVQGALTTAENQRAANQAGATNSGETAALNQLASVQTTKAQPEINALKTSSDQSSGAAAQLASTFAAGAADNNSAKTAAAAQFASK